MTTRRLLTAVSLTLIALVATGCGGDDDSADTTTTTQKRATTTEPVVASLPTSSVPDDTAAPTTTAAPDPAAFAAALAEMNGKLSAAGTDFCKIAQSASIGNLPAPSTKDETKSLYDYYKRTFDALTAVLPKGTGDGANDAQLLKDAAAKMIADAEATDYDPAKFPVNGPPSAFNEGSVLEAMQRLSSRIVQDCGRPTAPSGT